MHAKALDDPYFLVKLADADRSSKGALRPWCETCHGPVAGMAGLVGRNAGRRPTQAAEGVGCDFCHQVTGTTRPVGNASFKMGANRTKRAQWRDATSPVHETAFSAFHESPEFCGTCHDVRHPESGLPLGSTYSEWKTSTYAARGITCQGCHMTPGPGSTVPNAGSAAAFGVERWHLLSMTFVGGNAALGPKHLAEERLRAAAVVLLEAPDIVVAGRPFDIEVTVKNVGAGHSIPTGATELRRMWLDVVATDAAGRELLRQRKVFGTEYADSKGKHPVDPWRAVRVVSDDRIPAGGAAAAALRVTMPQDAPVTISAQLYYRGVPERLAERAGVPVPVTHMAGATGVVFASEAQQQGLFPTSPRDIPEAWVLPLIVVLVSGGLLTAMGAIAASIRRRNAQTDDRPYGAPRD